MGRIMSIRPLEHYVGIHEKWRRELQIIESDVLGQMRLELQTTKTSDEAEKEMAVERVDHLREMLVYLDRFKGEVERLEQKILDHEDEMKQS